MDTKYGMFSPKMKLFKHFFTIVLIFNKRQNIYWLPGDLKKTYPATKKLIVPLCEYLMIGPLYKIIYVHNEKPEIIQHPPPPSTLCLFDFVTIFLVQFVTMSLFSML